MAYFGFSTYENSFDCISEDYSEGMNGSFESYFPSSDPIDVPEVPAIAALKANSLSAVVTNIVGPARHHTAQLFSFFLCPVIKRKF